MSRLGWCLTGHHRSCPIETRSGIGCDCPCHAAAARETGEHAAEGENTETMKNVAFGLDGIAYEIALSVRQASELRAVLTPFMSVARRWEGVP